MHPATDLPAPPVHFEKLAAAIVSIAALAAVAGLVWIGAAPHGDANAAVDSPSGVGPWGVAGTWLALAVVLAVAAGLAGVTLARNRWAEAIREARVDRQALSALLDVWQWHSDADHRLMRLVPPSTSPAAVWSRGLGELQPLWERFECAATSPTALRECVLAQAPISDMAVSHRDGDGTVHHWLLRGSPRFDAVGRFSGYLGTARAVEAAPRAPGPPSLLAALPGAVLVGRFDGRGAGRIEHVNAAARELVGHDADGITSAQVLSRLPAQVAAAVRWAAENLDRDGGGITAVGGWLVQLRRIDAHPALQVLSLVSVPGAAGDDAAARASDHEAFSYTVSHDLRAPIRVVEGFTRIVKEDYGRLLDKIGNDHLDRVLGAAARMNSMIDALLNLSQLSARPLATQPVNLSQLARYVVDDLRRNAPERAVEVQIQDGLAVHGDPTLLRIVLENLLGNAWKYTAKASQARISFDSTLHAGRTAYLVRDNGAGFDMRFADRLFGVFQRLHSASDFEGTGVGLASVQRIVRRHGGEIWAESEVSRGASFYFTLRG
jgi:signal transduction histidine kinase